ncbi:MAG: substrate-binding domain-containing protein, partial [Spirochaetota bacterium]|nr:substrate-binding domain-containing protein [Spirochaetota bacterium]
MKYTGIYKMKFKVILIVVFTIVIFLSCSKKTPPVKPEILIYCGITMAEPVQEIADIIEEQENCKITILLDGSQNLLDIINVNKVGDLYLPGATSFLETAESSGHIVDTVMVGTMIPVLVFTKNNPKNIPLILESLADPEYRVVL